MFDIDIWAVAVRGLMGMKFSIQMLIKYDFKFCKPFTNSNNMQTFKRVIFRILQNPPIVWISWCQSQPTHWNIETDRYSFNGFKFKTVNSYRVKSSSNYFKRMFFTFTALLWLFLGKGFCAQNTCWIEALPGIQIENFKFT